MSSRFATAGVLLLLAGVTGLAQDPAPLRPRGFRNVRVEGMTTVRELQKTHGTEGFHTILQLNRIDLEHLRQGATLVVPESPATMAELSPFPSSLGPDTPPRLLLVSKRVQAFAAYEAGMRVRWGATSTGRSETPTPDGLFATNWRAKLRRSTDNAAWLLPWYFNFINASGVSFHQFDLPGYPASHACVRLQEADARWIYDWADTWVLADQGRRVEVHGTPVLVFGEYDFGKPGPWTRLADDPAATDVTSAEIDLALAPHRETLAQRAALVSRGRGGRRTELTAGHGPGPTAHAYLPSCLPATRLISA